MHFCQETYANPEVDSACVQEGSPLLDLSARLPVLSMQRALEEVSFECIPFIISSTPGVPHSSWKTQSAIE